MSKCGVLGKVRGEAMSKPDVNPYSDAEMSLIRAGVFLFSETTDAWLETVDRLYNERESDRANLELARIEIDRLNSRCLSLGAELAAAKAAKPSHTVSVNPPCRVTLGLVVGGKHDYVLASDFERAVELIRKLVTETFISKNDWHRAETLLDELDARKDGGK